MELVPLVTGTSKLITDLSIGMGWLVLHTPKAIEDFWSSTGATKSGLAGAMRMLKNRMKH